jgi:TRAP-type C4-dicarboxylate transport system permease small subunit
VFQTFLLSLLLVFGLLMAGLTLVFYMSWDIHLNFDAGGSANAHIKLPEVSWIYYALFTGLVLAAFVLLLRRLVAAWKKRSRKAIG